MHGILRFTRSEIRSIALLSLILLLIRGILVVVRLQAGYLQPLSSDVGMADTVMAIVKDSCLDVNEADSSDWDALRGIGPVLTKRILRYRDLLGGFYSLHQISEVYGIDSALFQQILPELCISSDSLRLLDVNQAAFKDLLRHPYLEFEVVKAICNYRDRNGPLTQTGVLHTAGVIPDSVWTRVCHYLRAYNTLSGQ